MRKINIHLTLDKRATVYCYEVNRGIRGITTSIIEFGPSAHMIPHISLIMGQMRDDAGLITIAKITQDAVSDESAIVFSVDPPYLEDVRNRYVFSDVRAGGAFENLRRKLHSLLNEKHLDVQTDYAEMPHLTLGHVDDHKDEVREYLRGVRAGFSICCPAVEISDAGPKGTCINSLYKFDLK
jgi:hypothetical protein